MLIRLRHYCRRTDRLRGLRPREACPYLNIVAIRDPAALERLNA